MSETQNETTKETTVDEAQVVTYLRTHPEFFVKHAELLSELSIPHDSGRAISLVEKQVHVFREQRDLLKRELAELIDIARQNDRFFEKSKRLLMHLLEAQSLDEALIMLDESIRNDFSVPFCSIVLLGDKKDYPASNVNLLSVAAARASLGTLLESSRAVCGRFKPEQLRCLFPSHAEKVKSAAVIPLGGDEHLGMLSLGSDDEHYFDSSMGSLFLSYISDTLSRILPPLLARERCQGGAEAIARLLE